MSTVVQGILLAVIGVLLFGLIIFIHEFGHFLDELMGFPSQTEGFYQEESGTAAALLRPYALTNEREYFADCFVYWLTYRDNSKKMAALQSVAPRTYAYFFMLEENGWQIAVS